MRDPALIRVAGPLELFAEGYVARLESWGYARQSRVGHLRLMADLSGWLNGRGLDSSALNPEVVEGFVADRRAAGHRDALSARSLRPLLGHLREVGAAPVVPRQLLGPVEAMLRDFVSYLTQERGLSVLTVRRDTDLVRPFLAARVVGAGDVLGVESLTAAEVTAFMLARSESVSPATVQRTGTALRSLLRFLHLRGEIAVSLVGAVPSAASWKLTELPKYLTPKQAPRRRRAMGLLRHPRRPVRHQRIVNRIARTRSSSGYFGGAATVPPCSLLFVQPGTSQRAAGPSRLRVRGAGLGTSTENGQSSQHAVDRLVQQGAGGSEVQPEAVSVARAVLGSLG